MTTEQVEAGIETLTRQIISVLDNSKIDDNRENSIPIGKVLSLFDALIITLASVECLGCREKVCKPIEGLMPAALKEAVQQPAHKGIQEQAGKASTGRPGGSPRLVACRIGEARRAARLFTRTERTDTLDGPQNPAW